MSNTYVHYGNSIFRPELIVKKLDRFDKPSGLWASPEDSVWGWKEWCEAEQFKSEEYLNESFKFTLKNNARVLHVYSLNDVTPYLAWDDLLSRHKLNLPMIYSEFDAMEVHMSGNWCELHDSELFYSWDVDSIVVWNPEVVELNKGENDG